MKRWLKVRSVIEIPRQSYWINLVRLFFSVLFLKLTVSGEKLVTNMGGSIQNAKQKCSIYLGLTVYTH